MAPTVALVDDCGADRSQCFLLLLHLGIHSVVCVVSPARVHGQGRRLTDHILQHGQELLAQQLLESPHHRRVLGVQPQLPVLCAHLQDSALRLPCCVVQRQQVKIEHQRRDCRAVVYAAAPSLVVHLGAGEHPGADVLTARQCLTYVRLTFGGSGPHPHHSAVHDHEDSSVVACAHPRRTSSCDARSRKSASTNGRTTTSRYWFGVSPASAAAACNARAWSWESLGRNMRSSSRLRVGDWREPLGPQLLVLIRSEHILGRTPVRRRRVAQGRSSSHGQPASGALAGVRVHPPHQRPSGHGWTFEMVVAGPCSPDHTAQPTCGTFNAHGCPHC